MKNADFFHILFHISTYSKSLSHIHTIDFHHIMNVSIFGIYYVDKLNNQ